MRLSLKPRTHNSFSFFNTQTVSSANGPVLLLYHRYFNALKILDKKTSFHDFQRTRSILIWPAHSHPEAAFGRNKAAQATEKSSRPNHITMVNKATTRLTENALSGFRYVELISRKF